MDCDIFGCDCKAKRTRKARHAWIFLKGKPLQRVDRGYTVISVCDPHWKSNHLT